MNKSEDLVFVLSKRDLEIKNEGYWALVCKRNEVEKLCQDVINEGLVEKCAYTDVKRSKTRLVRLYLNGEDKLAHHKLILYLIKNKYIEKIHNKRYPNMMFTYLNSDKTFTLDTLMDLETGQFKRISEI